MCPLFQGEELSPWGEHVVNPKLGDVSEVAENFMCPRLWYMLQRENKVGNLCDSFENKSGEKSKSHSPDQRNWRQEAILEKYIFIAF